MQKDLGLNVLEFNCCILRTFALIVCVHPYCAHNSRRNVMPFFKPTDAQVIVFAAHEETDRDDHLLIPNLKTRKCNRKEEV